MVLFYSSSFFWLQKNIKIASTQKSKETVLNRDTSPLSPIWWLRRIWRKGTVKASECGNWTSSKWRKQIQPWMTSENGPLYHCDNTTNTFAAFYVWCGVYPLVRKRVILACSSNRNYHRCDANYRRCDANYRRCDTNYRRCDTNTVAATQITVAATQITVAATQITVAATPITVAATPITC